MYSVRLVQHRPAQVGITGFLQFQQGAFRPAAQQPAGRCVAAHRVQPGYGGGRLNAAVFLQDGEDRPGKINSVHPFAGKQGERNEIGAIQHRPVVCQQPFAHHQHGLSGAEAERGGGGIVRLLPGHDKVVGVGVRPAARIIWVNSSLRSSRRRTASAPRLTSVPMPRTRST